MTSPPNTAIPSRTENPLTTAEAAEWLGYRDPSGIRRLVARGILHPIGRGARQVASQTHTRSPLDTMTAFNRQISLDRPQRP